MIAQSNYISDPRIMRQAHALEYENYNVDILGLGWPENPKVIKRGNITSYKLMNYFSQESIISYLFYSIIFFFKAQFKLLTLSLSKRYSLIQVHNMPDYLVFATIFHKIFGTPVLLDMHDLTVELFKEKWSSATFSFLSPILLIVEKLSCKFADHILTVTDPCIEILISRGIPASKISLILNTADETYFYYDNYRKFEIIQKDLNLFYHGTIAERFGIHEVIKALPKIKDSIPGTRFIVFGKYDMNYKTYLIKLIEELGLIENVDLNGMIKYEDINGIMHDKHIGVVPYLKTSYMDIALSTKSFEYAANGVPMVASSLKAMRSVYGNDSIAFYDAGNISELAELIIALCGNPDRRKQLSENAFNDLQKINWSSVKKKYIKIIENLIFNKYK
jgi:glycosyltransferase involved in cell wall biosynthesis